MNLSFKLISVQFSCDEERKNVILNAMFKQYFYFSVFSKSIYCICHGFKNLSAVSSMTLVYSSLVARVTGPSYSP